MPFTLLFATVLVASLAVKFWLATRQMRHVAAHRGTVPAAFAATVTLAEHQRAADYTLAKGRFGLLTTAFGGAVLLGWTLLGGLDALNGALRDALQPRFGDLNGNLNISRIFSENGINCDYFLSGPPAMIDRLCQQSAHSSFPDCCGGVLVSRRLFNHGSAPLLPRLPSIPGQPFNRLPRWGVELHASPSTPSKGNHLLNCSHRLPTDFR